MHLSIKNHSFQRDFKVAISSWVETGISWKMENDFTTSFAYRGHFQDAFWKYPKNVPSNKPLTFQHVLPSFMVLGLGLIVSIIMFMPEMMLCHNKKKIGPEQTPRINIQTVKLKRIATKEPVIYPHATVRKKDTIQLQVVAEIHDALRREESTEKTNADETALEPPTTNSKNQA